MKNINSAYRVRSTLKQVHDAPDARAVVEVWADVLGVSNVESNKRQYAVSAFLSDLHDEVELIKEQMSETGFTESLYVNTLERCNNIFAVQHLSSPWGGLKKQITSEVLVALGFCSEILPSEESELDPTKLKELSGLIEELRGMLADSELSVSARRIIEKHLAKVEEALSKYKAVGSRGLQDALQSVIGEAVMNEAELKTMKETKEGGKFVELIRKLKDAVISASNANQHADSLLGMTEKANRAMGLLQSFI